MALALAAGATATYRWWHNRPPFGPQTLAATATVLPVDNTTVAAEIARAGVPPFTTPHAAPGDQLIFAKVAWHKPPRPLAGGWLEILLIDKRTHRKPPMISASGLQPGRVAVGEDGVLSTVAAHHPWLRGAGCIANDDGGCTSSGVSVSVYTETSPAVLVAIFPAEATAVAQPRMHATAPISASDLMLALVLIGPDRQIYWTRRLYG